MLSYDELTQILLGHSAFQFVRAGAELGLFDLLRERPGLSREEIGAALRLQDRALDILLLGTASLRLVHRVNGHYENSPTITHLYDQGLWDTVRAVIGFEAYITYQGLMDFPESLRENSNVGLRRFPGTGPTLYHRLTENPDLSEIFYRFMHAWSVVASQHLVQSVDFTGYQRLLDVGGGSGATAIAIARAFPHLEITVLDLPGVMPLAQQRIAAAGLGDRVRFQGGDIFAELPGGYDAMLFSHVLQIWPLERDTQLLTNAYRALSDNGSVLILNSMSEDTGDGPVMSALASPFFTAMAGEGGMIYAWHKYEECLRQAGFAQLQRIRLDEALTPHGVIIATK